jgi:hypothetical protein
MSESPFRTNRLPVSLFPVIWPISDAHRQDSCAFARPQCEVVCRGLVRPQDVKVYGAITAIAGKRNIWTRKLGDSFRTELTFNSSSNVQ